jgi:aspartate/methionine/tyrosine aminotransferase
MYTREELTAIVDMAQKYNILVWYDAAYIDITYDGTK